MTANGAKVANNAFANVQIPPLADSRIGGDGHLGPRMADPGPRSPDPVHVEPFVVRSGAFSRRPQTIVSAHRLKVNLHIRDQRTFDKPNNPCSAGRYRAPGSPRGRGHYRTLRVSPNVTRAVRDRVPGILRADRQGRRGTGLGVSLRIAARRPGRPMHARTCTAGRRSGGSPRRGRTRRSPARSRIRAAVLPGRRA